MSRTVGAWRGAMPGMQNGQANARAAQPRVAAPTATTTTGGQQQQQGVSPTQLYQNLRTGRNLRSGYNSQVASRAQPMPAGGIDALQKPGAAGARGTPSDRLVDQGYRAVMPGGGEKGLAADIAGKTAPGTEAAKLAPVDAASVMPTGAAEAAPGVTAGLPASPVPAAGGAPMAAGPLSAPAAAPLAAEGALAPAVAAPAVEGATAGLGAATAAPIAAEGAAAGLAGAGLGAVEGGALGAAGAGAAGAAGATGAGAAAGTAAGVGAGTAAGVGAGAAGAATGAAAGTAAAAGGAAAGTAAGTAAGAAAGGAASAVGTGALAGSWAGPVGAAVGAIIGAGLAFAMGDGFAAGGRIPGGEDEGFEAEGLEDEGLEHADAGMGAPVAGLGAPGEGVPIQEEGLVDSATPGRADLLHVRVRRGSYVIPADVVSGVGQGNTDAGVRILESRLSSGELPGLARGGLAAADLVEVRLSGGEYVLNPETVEVLGQGHHEAGAKRLDGFIARVREHVMKKAATMPAPR
jgi:hypothetical protein